MRTITLTNDEWSVLVSAVGALLASMALDIPPGQPTPPQMVMVEALQAKLMQVNEGGDRE